MALLLFTLQILIQGSDDSRYWYTWGRSYKTWESANQAFGAIEKGPNDIFEILNKGKIIHGSHVSFIGE